MRRPLAIALVGALAASPSSVLAGVPLGIPATEITQILNHVELVLQYEQQLQTALNTLNSYKQMMLEGQNLMLHPFTPILNDLQQVFRITQGGFGMAYSLAQMDQQFRNTFTTFQPGAVPYSTAYQNWYSGTLGTLLQTLQRGGISQQQLMNSQAVTQRLQSMMQTPMGRNQAIEIGNHVALEELNSINKLQALFAADMQEKATFNGYQIQQDQAKFSAAANALQHTDRTADQKGW